MSTNAPSIPLFGDAYLADTRHLSLEEHGAYLQLMMIAWRSTDCALPDDDVRLARMLGISAGRWAKIKIAVMAFWTLSEKGWTQKRLSKERAFIEEKRTKNKSAAESRWNNQPVENKQSDECERISERNAPPPPPPPNSEEEEEEEGETENFGSVENATRLIGSAGGINHNPSNDHQRYADNLIHVREWMKLGATVDEMVDCARRACATNTKPIRTFRYLDPVIRQAIARRENNSHATTEPTRNYRQRYRDPSKDIDAAARSLGFD